MKEVEIDYLKKRNNLLEKLTELYIFIIIVIFPLCVDSTGFFKILECKYKCYLIIAITYIAISLTAIIYYTIQKHKTIESTICCNSILGN